MNRIVATLTFPFLMLTACATSTPSEPPTGESTTQSEENPAEPVSVEVLDLSSEETGTFLTANYPVQDSFTSAGVIDNLKEGCHQAIEAVQQQVETWYDYETIQCAGHADWTDSHTQIGAANFTGPQLSEISLATITPTELWDLATQTTIAPNYQ